MSPLKIAYELDTYAERRLIINKVTNADYVQIKSQSNVRYPAGMPKNDLHWCSNIDESDKFDIVHYFNQVNFGSAPFVSTFETKIPRFSNNYMQYGLDQIVDDKCKRLIAFSECTRDIQLENVERICPEYIDILSKKISVIHPPQELIKNDFSRFDNIKKIKIIFVGAGFFRKGGEVVLRTLDIFRKIYPIELTIISNLKHGHNVTQSDDASVEFVKSFVHKHAEWIKFYPGLPNDQVLNIISSSHIGLLPTFSETYGYSVLEMQAAGTPVITTDVRALREINNDDVGWLLDFPMKRGASTSTKKSEIDEINSSLEMQMLAILNSIVSDLSILKRKSFNSTNKIISQHNPFVYMKLLTNIYNSSF